MKKQVISALFLMLALAVMAQSPKQTFNRKVVVEQFTTAMCGYCPAGADRISSVIGGSSNYIWIKHHAGFYTDDLTNGIHEALLVFYGGNTSAPAVMLDRTRFDQSRPGPVVSIPNVSDFRTLVSEAKSVETYCKLYTPTIKFNPATRELKGNVSGRFGDVVYDENTRLVVFLVEDSIFMEQHDYYNGVSSNSYAVPYWHMGTVRDTITPLWGESLDVNAADNHSFSYDFSYTIPDDYVVKNCKVVAFVCHHNPNNINDRKIMNGSISDFCDQTLGIGETAFDMSLRLFPNPATDRVVLECDGEISQVSVFNALGQMVLQNGAIHGNHAELNVEGFVPGLYLVRIATAQGVATRQLVVK